MPLPSLYLRFIAILILPFLIVNAGVNSAYAQLGGFLDKFKEGVEELACDVAITLSSGQIGDAGINRSGSNSTADCIDEGLNKNTTNCGDCTLGSHELDDVGKDFIAGKEGYAGKLENLCSETVTTNCKINNEDSYGFYQDSKGYCTTGIGHLVARMSCADIDKLPQDSKDKKTKDALSSIKNKDDAWKDFEEKKKEYEGYVNNNVKVCLYQNEFNALVSFVFNVGPGDPNVKPKPIDGFLLSKLLKDINAGNFEKVREDLALWNKEDGNVSQGLTNRRGDEADMFEKTKDCPHPGIGGS